MGLWMNISVLRMWFNSCCRGATEYACGVHRDGMSGQTWQYLLGRWVSIIISVEWGSFAV